ncbi:hypothetical protein SALBM311S_04299 [Streptomyces alboniger]
MVAGEGVGAGAWMYHCHVQSHADMGMVGLFLVKKKDGTIPGTSRTVMADGSRPSGRGARTGVSARPFR